MDAKLESLSFDEQLAHARETKDWTVFNPQYLNHFNQQLAEGGLKIISVDYLLTADQQAAREIQLSRWPFRHSRLKSLEATRRRRKR